MELETHQSPILTPLKKERDLKDTKEPKELKQNETKTEV
jgi:hypothetical protein